MTIRTAPAGSTSPNKVRSVFLSVFHIRDGVPVRLFLVPWVVRSELRLRAETLCDRSARQLLSPTRLVSPSGIPMYGNPVSFKALTFVFVAVAFRQRDRHRTSSSHTILSRTAKEFLFCLMLMW